MAASSWRQLRMRRTGVTKNPPSVAFRRSLATLDRKRRPWGSAYQWSAASPSGDTTGWYIWAREEPSNHPDFFVPLHGVALASSVPPASARPPRRTTSPATARRPPSTPTRDPRDPCASRRRRSPTRAVLFLHAWRRPESADSTAGRARGADGDHGRSEPGGRAAAAAGRS